VTCPELGLGWALNQSCSSCRELSNAMSHSLRRRREEVDSRLLMVGSQIGNLTPGPSFAHNLGCKCPNGQCKAILDIYALRAFHWYKERTKVKRIWPLKSSSEFSGVLEDSIFPFLGVWVAFSHLALKWGCDILPHRRKGQCSHWHLEFSFAQMQLLSFWILGHLSTFAAWTLYQANLGVPKIPTLF